MLKRLMAVGLMVVSLHDVSAQAEAPVVPKQAWLAIESGGGLSKMMQQAPRKVKVRLISELVEVNVPERMSDPVLSKDLRMQFMEFLMLNYADEVRKLTLHDALPVRSAEYNTKLPITVHDYETSIKPRSDMEVIVVKGFKYVPKKFSGAATATPLIKEFQTIIWGSTMNP